MKDSNLLRSGVIKLLASTIILRCKVRFFTWNLGSAAIGDMRPVLEEDYRVLDNLCDDLAAQIIRLEGQVPDTYAKLLEASSISEQSGLTGGEMIAQLIADHRQLVADNQLVAVLTDSTADRESIDLILCCIDQHTVCAEKLEALIDPGSNTRH